MTWYQWFCVICHTKYHAYSSMLGCHKHVTATQAAYAAAVTVIPDWLFAKWISKCFATKKQRYNPLYAAVTNNPWVVDYTQIYPKLHQMTWIETKLNFLTWLLRKMLWKFACISFEFISTLLNLIFIRVIKKTLGNIPLAHRGLKLIGSRFRDG